ncbi:MAG: DUF2190 family protein [Planctomycetes bacterium]|nr:DUF2190 family protein [Planctomycetota bacterium]
MAAKARIYKSGNTVDHTPAGAVTGGTPTDIGGGLVGVPSQDVAASSEAGFRVSGVFAIACTSATGSAGDNVYWDSDGDPYGGTAGTGACTTDVSASDLWLGKLTAASAATDADSYVLLNGVDVDEIRNTYGAGDGAGAELVDVAGTFVDYANTATVPVSCLEKGDVVHIMGTVLAADFHTQEELAIKVLFGTEAILSTGDVVIVADDDTITFDLWVHVLTAGASGKISVRGTWQTDLDGTVVCYVVAPTGSNKAGLSEDISDDIIVKIQGDYKNAHADQESYCFLTVQTNKGNA